MEVVFVNLCVIVNIPCCDFQKSNIDGDSLQFVAEQVERLIKNGQGAEKDLLSIERMLRMFFQASKCGEAS